MSTAPRFVPLHLLFPFRELPPVPITFTNVRSVISLGNAAIFLVGGLTRNIAPAHTTVFHAYSSERYRPISERVPISMMNCGHRMRGTWTRRELTSTCGRYFPRGSTLASHNLRTVAELYFLVRLLSKLSWLVQCFISSFSNFVCNR